MKMENAVILSERSEPKDLPMNMGRKSQDSSVRFAHWGWQFLYFL